MRILGLSAFYHDSAAALIVDGEVIAAAQEERFTRIKHDSEFPEAAVRYCLEAGGCNLADIDNVAFYEKPFIKFERLLESYLATAPSGFKSFAKAVPVWIKEKLFQKSMLTDALRAFDPTFSPEKLLFAEHHQSHAASAFYPSPFEEAAVLTADGVGEWATTSLSLGEGNALRTIKEISFPHSLGLLYSAFTYYLGFKVNSGEYKVMGLAPYGEPRFAQTILDNLIDLKDDGSFWLDMRYFDYVGGLRMTNARFHELFDGPPHEAEKPLDQRHMDLAASVQAVVEEAMLRLARAAARETGRRNLCLAGGVALNCVANGHILRDGAFDRVWIQPAAGDAGGALGAALAAYHWHLGQPRQVTKAMDGMKGSYLGPSFENSQIESRLTAQGAVLHKLSAEELIERTASLLSEGQAVGWFQGRMEFGPRALGGRSILGDPRSPNMQRTLNLKVKYRESFRPFAPSVLSNSVSDWFELDCESPYMLLVAGVADSKRRAMSDAEEALFGIDQLNVVRSEIPAVTHVDYSARVQTVHEETNPRYHALLTAFAARTGCPVLVNTSFNVRGEPIVATPEDAFRCFMGCELDALAIGDFLLLKTEQNPALKSTYSQYIAPD
jgi:carbamoyltransferase